MKALFVAATLAASALCLPAASAEGINYQNPLIALVGGVFGANACKVTVPEADKQQAIRMLVAVYGEKALGMAEAIRLEVGTMFGLLNDEQKAEFCNSIAKAYGKGS
jgi:hypothetical protein